MGDTGTTLAILAFALNALVLIVGAVWTISKVRETSAVLGNTVAHLDRTIVKVETVIKELGGRVAENRERVLMLEQRHQQQQRNPP